jgi:hypothetical protein
VKPLFTVFVRGLKKKQWIWENNAGATVEIGFIQGPYKLNGGSGKKNYPGTIDRGFTVL